MVFMETEKKSRRLLIVLVVVFAALTGILSFLFWPLIRDLRNPLYREQFTAWVTGLGFKGVLILFGFMVLQIVVAVIPGGPVELIAGTAYGAFGGFAICAAGSCAATAAVFLMVKKFGLPLVRRFFGTAVLESWSFLRNEKKAARLVFILFIIPGIPKDTLTYLAPFSRLSLLRFTGVSVFARLPAILCTTIMGDAVMEGNWLMFFCIFAFTALAGFAGIQWRDRLIRRFSNRQVDRP
jgi:uncharacterized membrane protein YdjX (TVP38/TMEM64 family)